MGGGKVAGGLDEASGARVRRGIPFPTSCCRLVLRVSSMHRGVWVSRATDLKCNRMCEFKTRTQTKRATKTTSNEPRGAPGRLLRVVGMCGGYVGVWVCGVWVCGVCGVRVGCKEAHSLRPLPHARRYLTRAPQLRSERSGATASEEGGGVSAV